MKVTMTFTLPEDDQEHRDALQGPAYHRALHEIDDYLRNRLKHGTLSEELRNELEALRLLLLEEAPPGWDE